jgi:Rrf2 family protein
MLNQTAEYALRTAVFLAEQPPGSSWRAADLADRLGIPANYLSKILHQLARDGVLDSQRGRAGGFRLGKPAARVRLTDVVSPFDTVESRRGCLLGRPVCSDATPCQAHDRWKAIGASLADFFRTTTLASLISEPKATPAVRSPSVGTPAAPARREPRPTVRGRRR